MRVCVALGLIALAISVPSLAQTKNEKDKPVSAQPSRVILSNLQLEVPTAALQGFRFKDVLEYMGDKLRAGKREVTFVVDEEAFREENRDAQDILEAEMRFRSLPAKATVMHVLRLALKQLPAKTAMLVRAGQVEIVPIERTSKEYLLNHTFFVDFKDRPLDAALEELSELTGVSIVLDGRIKQKAQTPVTGRFRDDVALQDAVRMLSDMAELKMVYLVTGLYITTPEHALVMQKELKQIYGRPDQGGPWGAGIGGAGVLGGMLGGAPSDPTVVPLDPNDSAPLAPPLPPRRVRRLEGA